MKYLVFTGCTTSVCVKSTLRDAMFRDYSCVLLADCTAEPIGQEFARSNHDASLLLIERVFGWVSEHHRAPGGTRGIGDTDEISTRCGAGEVAGRPWARRFLRYGPPIDKMDP